MTTPLAVEARGLRRVYGSGPDAVHALRELPRENEQTDLAGVQRADFALHHLDADDRWLHLT